MKAPEDNLCVSHAPSVPQDSLLSLRAWDHRPEFVREFIMKVPPHRPEPLKDFAVFKHKMCLAKQSDKYDS